jgi:hypothetical protein
MQAGQVSFRWKDRANGNASRLATLDAEASLRRFLLHVLPSRFIRIRHYGFLANSVRRAALATVRRLLGQPATAPEAAAPTEPEPWEALLRRLTGKDVTRVPAVSGRPLRHRRGAAGGVGAVGAVRSRAEPMMLPDGRLPALVSSSRTPTTLRLRRVPISTTSLGHQDHPSSPSRAAATTSAGDLSGFVAFVIARSPLTALDQSP